MSSELSLQKHYEQATNAPESTRIQNKWCDSCTLNFNNIFTSSRSNLPLNYLSTFWKDPSITTCPMCQFLQAMYGSATDEQQHNTYAVYTISCLRYYALRYTSPSVAYPNLADSNLWVLLPLDRWSFEGEKPSPASIRSVVRDRGCIALLDPNDSSRSKERYEVRLLDAESIDWNRLKEWLGYCMQHHSLRCAFNTSGLIHTFVVIDCVERKTCECPANAEFLALSYVWGPPNSSSSTHAMTCGVELPDELPLVVEDAAKVTQILGFRYLWVDRYCISDDATIKHNQIKNMDLVYQSAYATIIAAAGEDPSYGLPGVSSRSRRYQPQVRMGTKTLASILPHPGSAIRRSKWATRAWTYQECLLSRRRIFFTDDQVYFECQGMHCCEVFEAPLDALHNTDRTRFRMSLREGLFHLQGTGPSDIWSRIEEYSQREMTYDSDALNGMLGLLRAFSIKRVTKPMSHLWGLPFFAGLYHQSLQPRREIDQFVKALCWRLVKPSKRRRGFPSWSWTGWKGAVCTRYTGTLLDREFSATENLEVCVQDANGEEVSWPAIIKKHDINTRELSPRLTIKATTLSISFYNHPTQSWTPQVLRHRTFELADCDSFHLCKDTSSDPAFFDRLQTERFTGIVIGDSQDRPKALEYLILVVDENAGDTDAAERIGFFVMDRAHVMRMKRKTRPVVIE